MESPRHICVRVEMVGPLETGDVWGGCLLAVRMLGSEEGEAVGTDVLWLRFGCGLGLGLRTRGEGGWGGGSVSASVMVVVQTWFDVPG